MPSVLVVRESDDFSRIIFEAGFSVINCPAIETAPLEDLSDFERRLEALENYNGVFLTSSPAARIFREKLRERNVRYGGKIYVLGKRSFDLLKNERLDLFFDETANTASEMLTKIAREDLREKRFLFVRGEQSLRVVPDSLREIARLDEATVYRTAKVQVADAEKTELCEKFASGEIVGACFFSPSAAESFIEQFGAKVLHQTCIATIGKTTAEFFERQNLKVGFVSPKVTAEDFAVGLVDYLRK